LDVNAFRESYEAELAEHTAEITVSATVAVAAEDPSTDLADQVSTLLTTVRDTGRSDRERLLAIDELAAFDFLGPRFDAYRPDFLAALRDVATDASATVRESALGLLAMRKDAWAQQELIAGLRAPQRALVPEAAALQLLSYDDHTESVPLARQVYERATGPTREEALLLLANDPQSEGLLTRLLVDKDEESGIRQISAVGLRNLNRTAFDEEARRIVADDTDYPEIRATGLAALTSDRESGEDDPDFVATVREIASTTDSDALRASTERYLAVGDE
jgi:hypothetical protein